MAVPAGNLLPINLGPRHAGSGSFVPLNLGVDWNVDPPDPPDPVHRGLRASADVAWRGAALQRAGATLPWGRGPSVDVRHQLPWRAAPQVSAGLRIAWGQPPRVRQSVAMPWSGTMMQARRSALLLWRALPRIAREVQIPWTSQGVVRSDLRIVWRALELVADVRTARWRYGIPSVSRTTRAPWLHPGLTRSGRIIPWGLADRVPWWVRQPPPPEPPEEPESPFPPGNRVGLHLACRMADLRGYAPLNLGVLACYAVRPQRRTYVVHNTMSVVRLPDRLPIHVDSVSISGSRGSWANSLEFDLSEPDDLVHLKPTPSGPREVEITLNGYVFTGIVESYSRRRSIGNDGTPAAAVPVSGRSRTAILAAPFAPARTKVAEADRTMAQLVDEELADTGFTATYDTVDWIVPGGAWSYDGASPMDAIARLAEASGAVVQSDPEAKAIRVRPAYPVSPWDWTTSTPDHVLQDDVVVADSMQVRSAPLYDAVVVTCELQGKGVTAVVKRAGEAGTLYAAQASSPLINADPAAAERGRNILSDRGEQSAETRTLPLFPMPLGAGQTGLVLPLDLVQVQEADGVWHGLCTDFRIEARLEGSPPALVIEQTLTLERHFSDAD